MKRTTLATLVALAAGTMNILPWGGPTIRAATAAGVDVMELFSPMLVPVLAGLVTVVIIAVFLGRKEKAALGVISADSIVAAEDTMSDEEKALLRPKLFWVNIIIIVLTIVALVKSGFSPAVVFMVAFCVGMLVNYPDINTQKKIVNMHAQSALMMASVLFAAGAFIGVMKGTGMITAMASALVAVIPASLGHFFPLIVGIIAMPASLLFDPDSFYYGVLPVLMETGTSFGVTSLDIARAAITGQMTLGFPVSPLTPATFLLIGLAGIELGEHQKHTFGFAWLVSLVILAVAIVIGAITL
jgi:CitMHS family citrate-Mg2+:H+ or citrate-Ca2+:H+ symporter